MKPLVIPPAAQRDEKSVQLLSAWAAERGLHCSLNVGKWHESGRDEAAGWGILLSDVARHIANAMQQQYGVAPADTIAGIRRAFDREFAAPTSEVEGNFHPGHS